ncbi:Uncharacterized protein family UPF0642 [Babesia duncani]|uniref:Uncharacterized protein family UPF0642 n=1 Tax=Babesia duncani TaxID=323732 RepID=A0AAD9PNQ9_9APIC|nr:Uncharacterized protein family UPF0642 [Babesia duncani]
MAKGLRAKSLRRYRSAKRQVINEVVELPRIRELNKKLKLLKNGIDITPKVKKNRFLYPDDHDAIIPQRIPEPALDLRSENVPLSGLAGAYNRRKFDADELKSSTFLSKNMHGENAAMELDESKATVSSSQRQGNFKSGKAKKYASKQLEKIKKT